MPAQRRKVSLSRMCGLIAKPPGSDFRGDMPRSKAGSSMKQVVGFAPQAEVRSVGCARPCVPFDVVELEKPARIAAPTVCRNERTLTAVATVNLSPYRRSHVTSTLSDGHCASPASVQHSAKWWQ